MCGDFVSFSCVLVAKRLKGEMLIGYCNAHVARGAAHDLDGALQVSVAVEVDHLDGRYLGNLL